MIRKNNFQFLVAFSAAVFVAITLVPIHSGADPDLPDEAFAQNIPANDPFPHQVELAARVNFWRHVFGVWGNRQVALHDMSNPGLVYEVLSLPEGTRGANRKDFINEHVEDLMRRLYTLEQKVALGKDLDDNEQGLLNKFRTLGKISQLAGAHDRVRIQYGIRDKFLNGVEASGRYDAIFRRIFRSYGVPEDLAFLPHVESSFQAHARSGAGAVGIWQFTLPAARTFMKVNAAVDERYDPVLAAEGCARYLAYAHEKLGDWGLAITSYNHGVGGMARAESEFGNDFLRILEEYEGPQFGFDSRNFYVEFLAAREVARHAERYFAEVHRERPQAWEKVALDHSAPIYKVARDYGVTLSELTEMNTALTNSALKGRVSLPEGTSIWLPSGTQQRLASRSPEEEEETTVESKIRVVRTPDPTQGRMMAMIDENSLSASTRIDTPTTYRRALSVRNKMDKDANSNESQDSEEKINIVREKKVESKAKETIVKANEKSQVSDTKVTVIKTVVPVKTLVKVEMKKAARDKVTQVPVTLAKVVPSHGKMANRDKAAMTMVKKTLVAAIKVVPNQKQAIVPAKGKIAMTKSPTPAVVKVSLSHTKDKNAAIKIAMTKAVSVKAIVNKPIAVVAPIPKKAIAGGKLATTLKVNGRRG
ncbi:membrane-bound lytic murein transglycosylase D [Gammaproteobacteria bacterium]